MKGGMRIMSQGLRRFVFRLLVLILISLTPRLGSERRKPSTLSEERVYSCPIIFSLTTVKRFRYQRYVSTLNRSKELASLAWGYLNDSMRTPLCCAPM